MNKFSNLLATLTSGVAYAGIGSRETSPEILILMALCGKILGQRGFTLRSGGADKADLAFEIGAQDGKKEIFLPWPGFNKSKSTLVIENEKLLSEAREIARKYHPVFDKLKPSVQNMHTRNVMQALGQTMRDEDFSAFALCYTVDGGATGGTGQAIRIMDSYGIPVFNLQKRDHVKQVTEALGIRWPLSEMEAGRDDWQILEVKRIIADLLKRGKQIDNPNDPVVVRYA